MSDEHRRQPRPNFCEKISLAIMRLRHNELVLLEVANGNTTSMVEALGGAEQAKGSNLKMLDTASLHRNPFFLHNDP